MDIKELYVRLFCVTIALIASTLLYLFRFRHDKWFELGLPLDNSLLVDLKREIIAKVFSPFACISFGLNIIFYCGFPPSNNN